MSFDEKCVNKIVDVLSSIGNPFNSKESLVNLCSGIKARSGTEAPADIANDLFNALQRGLNAAVLKIEPSQLQQNEVRKTTGHCQGKIKRIVENSFKVFVKPNTVESRIGRWWFGQNLPKYPTGSVKVECSPPERKVVSSSHSRVIPKT